MFHLILISSRKYGVVAGGARMRGNIRLMKAKSDPEHTEHGRAGRN